MSKSASDGATQGHNHWPIVLALVLGVVVGVILQWVGVGEDGAKPG